MLTKEQLLKIVVKYGRCKGVNCEECPYFIKTCANVKLKRIGAMAILRQNKIGKLQSMFNDAYNRKKILNMNKEE